MVSGDLKEAKTAFLEYSKKVRMIRDLKEDLDSLEMRGFEDEMSNIRRMMKDPEKVEIIKKQISDLQDMETSYKVEEMQELEGELEAQRKAKERNEKAGGVYDLILKHQGGGTLAQSEGDVEGDVEGEGEGEGANGDGYNVDERFQFSNFVIGTSNQFAQAAASSVADAPGKSYNPLFIWSGPGLGKTHLMIAIANKIKADHPDYKILYMSVEKFMNELIEAVQNNGLGGFREKYRSVDVLILDDIQFLAGQEQTQEEFFHTFNTLHTAGKQIILASDRPPKEIPTLKNRLISRFEGGLITDMQPPDLETRTAILAKKAKEDGISVDNNMLGYIARREEGNIRELLGLLNRVVAFSSMMKREITLDLIKEVLHEDTDAGGPGTRPSAKPSSKPKFLADEMDQAEEGADAEVTQAEEEPLEPGSSYLFLEDSPDRSICAYKELVAGGATGLYVTRANPKRVVKKFKLTEDDVVWLTNKDSSLVATIPPSLERISYRLEEFVKEQNGVFLLDGIEYLVSANNFEAVLRFIRKGVDDVSESESIFIISLSPNTLQKQELSILGREMEVVE